jgi:hypothetical protein
MTGFLEIEMFEVIGSWGRLVGNQRLWDRTGNATRVRSVRHKPTWYPKSYSVLVLNISDVEEMVVKLMRGCACDGRTRQGQEESLDREKTQPQGFPGAKLLLGGDGAGDL